MNALLQYIVDSGNAMWIFWLVVSTFMFFFVRACIRHSMLAAQNTEGVGKTTAKQGK